MNKEIKYRKKVNLLLALDIMWNRFAIGIDIDFGYKDITLDIGPFSFWISLNTEEK